jgi:hypothetical protein
VAALALALASVAAPARPLPLLGQMEISLTWSPGHPPVGGTVTFIGTASDNDGAVREARICYGDGICEGDSIALSSLQLLNACVFGDNWGPRSWQHRYTRAGTFQVKLTVTSRGCPIVPDETRSYTASITVG